MEKLASHQGGRGGVMPKSGFKNLREAVDHYEKKYLLGIFRR
jgi:hypothetical protein